VYEDNLVAEQPRNQTDMDKWAGHVRAGRARSAHWRFAGASGIVADGIIVVIVITIAITISACLGRGRDLYLRRAAAASRSRHRPARIAFARRGVEPAEQGFTCLDHPYRTCRLSESEKTNRELEVPVKPFLMAAIVCILSGVNASAQWATCTAAPPNSNGCNAASIGIGTTAPEAQLHLTQQLRIDGSDSGGYRAIEFGGNSIVYNPNIYTNGSYLVVNAKYANALYLNWDAGPSSKTVLQANGGNVGIGSVPNNSNYKLDVAGGAHFAGDVVVDGSLAADYQDVAEWVPATESMRPGTVAVLSASANNTVAPSMHAYDTGVAGVVSCAPGLLLGIASTSKAKIATTGRVIVRVDATKQPIHIGDLLVTSDRPGMAMKSEPLDLGGVKIHRPGTLIGKALEPLSGGEGEILVLLSLQ
jgi:hypothetical protein